MQFSFKVVDARIDACHRSLKLVFLEHPTSRFQSDTGFDTDKQVRHPAPHRRTSTTGQL
jgi:hypothetical protein